MKNLLLFLGLSLILASCNNEQKGKTNSAPKIEKKISSIKDFKTCANHVKKIVMTSPSYLEKTKGLYDKVVDKGGFSVGVSFVASPYNEFDGATKLSTTYDYSIHETYVRKRVPVADFSFHPKEGKLYERDKSNQLIPISFNNELLKEFMPRYKELRLPSPPIQTYPTKVDSNQKEEPKFKGPAYPPTSK